MDFMSIFFIGLSIVVILYLISFFKSKKRMPILLEVISIGVYGVIFLLFLFPNILTILEETLGIASAINFIIYLSIFVAYFIIFILYKKSEEQRVEITKLVREIVYLKKNGEKGK